MKHVYTDDHDSIISGIGLLSAGVSQTFSFRITKFNRDLRWLFVVATAAMTSKGVLESVYGFIQDVTELRRAVAALEENARRLSQAANESNVRVWVSKELSLVGPTSEFLKSSNLAPNCYTKAMHPHDRVLADQRLAEAKREAKPVIIDVRLNYNDNFCLLKKIFITPIKDAGGRVQEWHGASFIFQRESSESPQMTFIDGRHIRAARALLDWSLTDLEIRSKVSISIIRRAETSGFKSIGSRSAYAIRNALNVAGVTFNQSTSGDISICDRISL